MPLSAQGEADSERIARAFAPVGFRAVISSDLVRARTLGEALARLGGAPLAFERGLAEIQRGRWQGRPMAELFAECGAEIAGFHADPWNYGEHGGETDRDVLARAWPVLERALEGHGGPLALTTHYNVIRVLVAHALGIAPAHSFRLRVDLGGATLLRDTPRGWVLARSNVRGPDAASRTPRASSPATGSAPGS